MDFLPITWKKFYYLIFVLALVRICAILFQSFRWCFYLIVFSNKCNTYTKNTIKCWNLPLVNPRIPYVIYICVLYIFAIHEWLFKMEVEPPSRASVSLDAANRLEIADSDQHSTLQPFRAEKIGSLAITIEIIHASFVFACLWLEECAMNEIVKKMSWHFYYRYLHQLFLELTPPKWSRAKLSADEFSVLCKVQRSR